MNRTTRQLLIALGIPILAGLLGWSGYQLWFSQPTPGQSTPVSSSPVSGQTVREPIETIDEETGLFFVSDTAETFYKAPILETDVQMEVSGLLVQTTVRQHFYNPSNQWLEGLYLFPLPERSAVDRLRMQIGNRFIEGVIEEKEEAKRVYEQAKRQANAPASSPARGTMFSPRASPTWGRGRKS